MIFHHTDKISYRVEAYSRRRYRTVWEGRSEERAFIQANKSYNRRHGRARVVQVREVVIHVAEKKRW